MGLGSEIRDLRSGIREKPIPDPGSRGQKGTGSRIRIRNSASNHRSFVYLHIDRLAMHNGFPWIEYGTLLHTIFLKTALGSVSDPYSFDTDPDSAF